MADLLDARDVPLYVQIASAERELRMRKNAYPRWVNAGKMTQALADQEIAAMAAIVKTLREVAEIGHSAAASVHGA